MEDKILILRFKRGSTDALCRIYRKYEGVMLTVAAGLMGDVHATQDAVHDVFVAFAQSPERLRLADALATLPYEQREVVVLHLKGDLTFRQIAAVQGTSLNTVQSRYRYGIDKLRSLLNGEVER